MLELDWPRLAVVAIVALTVTPPTWAHAVEPWIGDLRRSFGA